MEFALSEEQQELAATVRGLLAKRADPRAASFDEGLWRTLCEQIGVAALGIPEEYGGAGFTLFESLVALEEVGRSLAPLPLLASLVTSEALLAGADEDAKQRLLPRLAAGEVGAFADGADASNPPARTWTLSRLNRGGGARSAPAPPSASRRRRAPSA